jgi:hypothetical protein
MVEKNDRFSRCGTFPPFTCALQWLFRFSASKTSKPNPSQKTNAISRMTAVCHYQEQ